MTASVDSISSEDNIAYAARRMAEIDVALFRFSVTGQLVRIVTEREIAIRAVAADVSPDVPVRRIMSDRGGQRPGRR